MYPDFEQLITRIEAREFGPDDPRTPSIASVPGGPLSFENQRKILEHERLTVNDIEYQKKLNAEEIRKFWSDPQHLEDRLREVTETITQLHLLSEEEILLLAIFPGTGDIVLPSDKKWHAIDIQNNTSGEIFLHRCQGELQDDQATHLRTLASFKPAA